MNKARRKSIEDVIAELQNQVEAIDGIYDEECEALENMPEGLQESERGQQMQENIDALDCAKCDLESVIEQLQEIVDNG